MAVLGKATSGFYSLASREIQCWMAWPKVLMGLGYLERHVIYWFHEAY